MPVKTEESQVAEPALRPVEDQPAACDPWTTDELSLVVKMLTPRAPSSLERDVQKAHILLDVAGVPTAELVAERIAWVARRWLELAEANGHSDGCQDIQCTAARKIALKDFNLYMLEELGIPLK